MTITVACLWIRGKGKRRYGPEYVDRLRFMVARHLSLPHRFVCMTDLVDELPAGVEPIRIKRPENVNPWWLKLKLFQPKMGWAGRVLYLDLDLLVIGSLDPIATFAAPLALLPDMAPGFTGSPRRPRCRVVHRYNSSVMAFDGGANPELWNDWSKAVTARLWSDQDWIGERCPALPTFPKEWFERLAPGGPPEAWPPGCRVVLCVKTKNAAAAKQWPRIMEWWR